MKITHFLAVTLMGIAAAFSANAFDFGTPHINTKYVRKVVAEAANAMPVPQAAAFDASAGYQLCFVPDGLNCERLLVQTIQSAQSTILVQAYSFTSTAIAKAIVDAHHRGVRVHAIVDKSQISEKYTSATFLKNAGIEVVNDNQPAIAHNKIMIFDGRKVFTGSFNFTASAAQRNTENGILIHGDQNIVNAYTQNWKTRYSKSVPYTR
jgi:phosphatidylserine/phosphatidylglycerophosphate/cardiolipin synthase-like enzyme